MRVTHSALFQQQASELQRRLQEYAVYQRGGATGRRIEKPSDDANDAVQLALLSAENEQEQQYLKNIRDGLTRVSSTEAALQRLNEILTTIRADAVAAGSGTYTSDERQAAATEIDQLLREVASIANQQANGRYIFGGARSDTAPFQIGRTGDGSVTQVTADWVALDTQVFRDIAPGEALPVSIRAGVFRSDDTTTLFSVLIDLRNELRDSNSSEQVTEALPKIDLFMSKIAETRAETGELVNRLKSAETRSSDRGLTLTDQIATKQDWDVADLMLKYQQAETAYSMALQLTPRLFNLSLLQFIQ